MAYVPHILVKDILFQPEADGKKESWNTLIQEYDMVIKPTKLIKGQGIEKLMVEANLQAVDINAVEVQATGNQEIEGGSYVKYLYRQSPWYQDISYLLETGLCPRGMDKSIGRRGKFIDQRHASGDLWRPFCI